MRKVICHECDKRYDYDDDGFCPRCGAFNVPAHANRIGADGSLVWVDGINERNHKNSFAHEELHREEKKRRQMKLDRDPEVKVLRPALGQQSVRSVQTGKKKKPALLGAIVALVIFINFILPTLFIIASRW